METIHSTMRTKFLIIAVLVTLMHKVEPVFAQVAVRKTISIQNKSSIDFFGAVITIPWNEVLAKYPAIDTVNFKVINTTTKMEIPFQLEYIGEAVVQNLLLQLGVAKKSEVRVALIAGKHKSFVSKTYCSYVPERKDDFAWENDRIAMA